MPPRGIPPYIGSTFTHLTGNRQIIPANRPPMTTLPRAYPTLMTEDFATSPMLHNRTANGKILGSVGKRFITENHIPYLPPELPVGPDNPYQQLNDIWYKCWDKEAGAVYYYNQQTGEATWIQPDI
jgi:hypothetical protein